MFNTFFLLHRLIYTVLCQKDFEKPPSERTSNSDSGNIANIVICFYVLKFSKEYCFTLPFYCTVPGAGQKLFILSAYCTALFTKRFEPPDSLSMSKKK